MSHLTISHPMIPVHEGSSPIAYPAGRLFQWDGVGDAFRLDQACRKLLNPTVPSSYRSFGQVCADGTAIVYANFVTGYSGLSPDLRSFRAVELEPGDWVYLGSYNEDAYRHHLKKFSDSYVQAFFNLTGTV